MELIDKLVSTVSGSVVGLLTQSDDDGVVPVLSFNWLAATDTTGVSCNRNSVASYINSDGEWAQAAINTARLQHCFGSGVRRGLLNEEAATTKNNYARPSSGAVGDHFSNGSSNVTVVTDATAPITSDFTNHDSVWEVANSTGGDVTIDWAGATGNTTSHNIQITAKIVSGDGYAVLSVSGEDPAIGEVRLNSRDWYLYSSAGITPADAAGVLRLVVPDGMTIRFFAANMQQDAGVADRYVSHYTTFIDSAGSSTSRDDEFLTIDGVGSVIDSSQGALVVHGEFIGAEETNSGALSLYNSSGQTTDYIYLRASPNGDWLWFGEGGNSTFVSKTIPIQAEREQTPLDVSFAFRWSSGDSNVAFRGEAETAETTTNVPTGLDSIALYRHDNGARNDTTGIYTKLELYTTPLSDAELERKSNRVYGFGIVSAGQSNPDITFGRGYGSGSAFDDGAEAGGSIYFQREVANYLPNVKVMRGPAYEEDDGGGRLLKSTASATPGYYVDDDDTSNYQAGPDALQVVDTVKTQWKFGGAPLRMFWGHWQFESGLTREEIKTDYKDGLRWLFQYWRSRFGPLFEIYLLIDIDRFATNDDISAAHREVLFELEEELSYVKKGFEATKFNLDTNSNAHYENESDYMEVARHIARRCIKDVNGKDIGNLDNPFVSTASFTSGGSDITLECVCYSGATLTANTSKSLWRVLVNGSEATVSSWTVSGTTITLTLSSALSTGDVVTVDWAYYLLDYDRDGIGAGGDPQGADENDSGQYAVRDNSAWALPLAMFSALQIEEV